MQQKTEPCMHKPYENSWALNPNYNNKTHQVETTPQVTGYAS